MAKKRINKEPVGPPPLEFRGGRIAVTDDDALIRIRAVERLSPSSSGSIQKCPARYAADRLTTEKFDRFSQANLGTAAHTVLEELFSLPAPKRTAEATRLILNEMKVPGGRTNKAVRQQWREDVWVRVSGEFDIERPSSILVRSTEWMVDNVDVAGVPFRGVIDRADITGDEHRVGVSIADYKSSAKVSFPAPWGDPHGDQIRLYVAAVEAADGRRPVSGRLLYTRIGEQRFVSLSSREMTRTLDTFSESWGLLNKFRDDAAWPAKYSKLCGWCQMAACCPVAREHDVQIVLDESVLMDIPVAAPLIAAPSVAAPLLPPETAVAEPPYEGPVVGPVPDATHKDSYNEQPGEEMSYGQEDRPWVQASGDGSLNPASYAATAAFGLVSMAVKLLDDSRIPMTSGTVSALAGSLAKIVFDAQTSMTGSASMQSLANTRLRGALHSTLDTMPPPFGGTSGDWAKWSERATKRVQAISVVAVALWENGPGETPWAVLAVDPVESEADFGSPS